MRSREMLVRSYSLALELIFFCLPFSSLYAALAYGA